MTPGIYPSLPAEKYFTAPGVSASMLSIIHEQSPAHLRSAIDGGSTTTKALEFGTLFHSWVLEPEKVASTFHVRPDEIGGEKWHGSRKACKDWLAQHSDRPIVTAAEIEHVKGMSESLRRNSRFMRLFDGGESEVSLFARDGHGILRRGRLDRFHRGVNYLMDLKSCVSAKPEEFEKAIWDHGYHRKAAWYIDLANLLGEDIWEMHLVAVEKKAPYANKIYTLRSDNILVEAGRRFNERDLAVYRQCVINNHWPGYGESPHEPEPPAWARKELEAII